MIPSTVPRPFALVRTDDQWSRAAHNGTALDAATGGVELRRVEPSAVHGGAAAPALGGGLAFDAECRLYHSIAAENRVERLLWSDERTPHGASDLFVRAAAEPVGDFLEAAPSLEPLAEPRGLAVDQDDRLFIAETAARQILVFDLWSPRILRRVSLPGRPLALAAQGRVVYAVLDDPNVLARLEARTGPRFEAPPKLDQSPEAKLRRIAFSPEGERFLLYRGGDGDEWVVPPAPAGAPFRVPGATDLAFEPDGTLVVARRPGEDFLRWRRRLGGFVLAAPAKARGYDGLGIVAGPDGHVGFWSERGYRRAVAARDRFVARGTVTTYRLDSGEYQTEWGRVFLDACIPPGTEIRLHTATSDGDDEGATVPRTPPADVTDVEIRRPDLSPPLEPLPLAPTSSDEFRPLYRRTTGRELPWSRAPHEDLFETYEAPVIAPAGRYLWVTLELSGTTKLTPRVKALRAEHPSHDYLRRLPRTFSRDSDVAAFLRRYLAMFDGTLEELEARSEHRDALLEPHGTPSELLPWLASFLGLTLDERWPLAKRRALIAACTDLFRMRGTVGGLRRFLQVYLDVEPILIEQYRLRGRGSALVGGEAAEGGTVVGASFRVGGQVAVEDDPAGTTADAFETHAHRFTVLIPATLDQRQLDVVRYILDVHRPAHTLVDVCTAGAGMRVGRGLHVGLLSTIGRTGGFKSMQLGTTSIGHDAVLGRPEAGVVPESSKLGKDTTLG